MLSLIASLFFAAASATPAMVCDVGRVALRDLPPVGREGDGVDFVDIDHGLLAACPALLRDLPRGYAPATADARARASVHVPVAGGEPVRPAYIYSIDLPRLAADGRSATVAMQYDCTGLCGGGFETRYVHARGGWRRQGDRRQLWVS